MNVRLFFTFKQEQVKKMKKKERQMKKIQFMVFNNTSLFSQFKKPTIFWYQTIFWCQTYDMLSPFSNVEFLMSAEHLCCEDFLLNISTIIDHRSPKLMHRVCHPLPGGGGGHKILQKSKDFIFFSQFEKPTIIFLSKLSGEVNFPDNHEKGHQIYWQSNWGFERYTHSSMLTVVH